LEGRMEREEGIDPDVVQLGIRSDGGDRHPVKREEGGDDDERQRDVEGERAPERPAGPDRHGQSLRRMYQRWNTLTTRRNGKRVSEIEAPCPSFAARMAIS